MEWLVAIIVAVIGGIFSITGIVITTSSNRAKITSEIKMSQAVTDTELKDLKEEVKQLRGRTDEYMERIPKMEVRIENLEDAVKEIRKQ